MNSAQIKILLVEDNPVDVRVIEGYLQAMQGLAKISAHTVAELRKRCSGCASDRSRQFSWT